MKLRKIDVKRSIEMWTWLHENPMKGKEDYPMYCEHGFNMMDCDCPLCDRLGSCSSSCPLYVKLEWHCAGGVYSSWFRSVRIMNEKISHRASGEILELLKSYWIKRGWK